MRALSAPLGLNCPDSLGPPLVWSLFLASGTPFKLKSGHLVPAWTMLLVYLSQVLPLAFFSAWPARYIALNSVSSGSMVQSCLQPCIWLNLQLLLTGLPGWTLDLVHHLTSSGTVSGSCYQHATAQIWWEGVLVSDDRVPWPLLASYSFSLL